MREHFKNPVSVLPTDFIGRRNCIRAMHCHYEALADKGTRENKRSSPKNLPSDIAPRGLTAKQAAKDLYGISLSGFYKERREGRIPGPTLPGGRYDRKLLEAEMDRQSGITNTRTLSPLEQWKANRARSAQRH
jgi:hypothetical protein